MWAGLVSGGVIKSYDWRHRSVTTKMAAVPERSCGFSVFFLVSALSLCCGLLNGGRSYRRKVRKHDEHVNMEWKDKTRPEVRLSSFFTGMFQLLYVPFARLVIPTSSFKLFNSLHLNVKC